MKNDFLDNNEIYQWNLYRSGYLHDILESVGGDLRSLIILKADELDQHDLFCVTGMIRDEMEYRIKYNYQFSWLMKLYSVLDRIKFAKNNSFDTLEYKCIETTITECADIIARYVTSNGYENI